MSQWDNIELSHAIEQKKRVDEMNAEASRLLIADDLPLARKTRTVINRRTGKKHNTTFVEYMQEQQHQCIQKFWLREPRSNSNGYVFRMVVNRPGSDISEKYSRVLISRTVERG